MDVRRLQRILAFICAPRIYLPFASVWAACCLLAGFFLKAPNLLIYTGLEIFLILLLFVGIPAKILREHIFLNRLIFSSFCRACTRGRITCVDHEKLSTSEASLLAYWADVVLVLAAIRLLQWAEGSVPHVLFNLGWLLLLVLYWFRAVHWLTNGAVRIAVAAGDATLSSRHIHDNLERLGPRLVVIDCVLWLMLALIATPPTGVVVVGLFLMTANPLIEQLTKQRTPLEEMVKPANLWQISVLLAFAGVAVHLQTQPHGLLDSRAHGYAYGLIVYLGVLVVAVWRSAEEQGEQYSLLEELWLQIRSVVHNTKNEARSIAYFHEEEIIRKLPRTAVTRLRNMLHSVLGIWLVVNPNWYYTMKVRPVEAGGDITLEILGDQVQNVVESALASKASVRDGKIVAGPDAEAWDSVSALVENIDLDTATQAFVKWNSSHREWKVCHHGNTKIPDRADIGLLYTCIAEMIRNAFRHNGDPPGFLLRVSDDEHYLRIEVTNNAPQAEFEKLAANAEGSSDNGGLSSLRTIARVFNLRLHVVPDEQSGKFTVSLEVKKAQCLS